MNKEVREIKVCGRCGREVKRRRKNYPILQRCPFCGGSIKTKYVMDVK